MYIHNFVNGICTICDAADDHIHSYGYNSVLVYVDSEHCGYTCETCDYIKLQKHNLQMGHNDDYHYVYCGCGYEQSREPHDWGLWITVDTYRHKGCYVCGRYVECGTSDNPHDFDGDICTVCGYIDLGGRTGENNRQENELPRNNPVRRAERSSARHRTRQHHIYHRHSTNR